MLLGGYFWWKKTEVVNLALLSLYFHLKVYGIPYTRTYMEFRGIPRNWTVKNFAELREIKPIPYKIPYSAEFQNGTSENTLRETLLSGDLCMWWSDQARGPEEWEGWEEVWPDGAAFRL
jgi:hypothetical protein